MALGVPEALWKTCEVGYHCRGIACPSSASNQTLTDKKAVVLDFVCHPLEANAGQCRTKWCVGIRLGFVTSATERDSQQNVDAALISSLGPTLVSEIENPAQ